MKRFAMLALAAAVLATPACHMFSKKKNLVAPKENPNMAADVEKDFMRRWIDKRTSELVAQGRPMADARAQATSEFKARYSYTDAARQIK